MTKKGFTLIELMVIVVIMLIMASIVLFNYTQFNESTLLNSFAYDLSLTIRQAQTYGVATKEGTENTISSAISTSNFGGSSTNNFSYAYGVHFDMSNPSKVIMFSDAPTVLVNGKLVGDGVYNFTDDGPPLQTYLFQRGIKIAQICYDDGSATNSCTGSGISSPSGVPALGIPIGSSSSTLDITFLRPDPEARIGINGTVLTNINSVTIYLQNAASTITKSVTVYPTGQIAVNNS